MRKHRVRFILPDDEQINIETPYARREDATVTVEEKRQLWYTKRELLVHRQDVKHAIKVLREMPTADIILDNDVDENVCMRGCERYFNLELRSILQKTMVEAVLHAQTTTKDWNAIRKVSESFSDSAKDMAVWHATINAYHCWGTSRLKRLPSKST